MRTSFIINQPDLAGRLESTIVPEQDIRPSRRNDRLWDMLMTYNGQQIQFADQADHVFQSETSLYISASKQLSLSSSRLILDSRDIPAKINSLSLDDQGKGDDNGDANEEGEDEDEVEEDEELDDDEDDEDYEKGYDGGDGEGLVGEEYEGDDHNGAGEDEEESDSGSDEDDADSEEDEFEEDEEEFDDDEYSLEDEEEDDDDEYDEDTV